MLIDTHCHLTFPELSGRVEELMIRARAFGVIGCIDVGTDAGSSAGAVAHAGQFTNIWATSGIHPHEALGWDSSWDSICRLAETAECVAIGETGLDHYRSLSPVDVQRESFVEHIRLALSLDKPLVIHSREAWGDVLKLVDLEGKGKLRGVFHCMSGSKEEAKAAIELGFHVSFSGTVTYPKAKALRETAEVVPLERLLVETDAPYLAPQPRRGKTNEPAFTRYTGIELAGIHGVDLTELAGRTTANASELFGIKPEKPEIHCYLIGNSIYINLVQDCPADCAFCPRDRLPQVQGHDLSLRHEPTEEEVIASLPDLSGFDEIVFCGFGEPTMRLDLVKSLAARFKGEGHRTRLNTVGLGDLINSRPIAPELAGLFDEICISLNSGDEQQYRKLLRPRYEGAFEAARKFIAEAVKHVAEVKVSAVDLDSVDSSLVKRIAEEAGARFLDRPYNELGSRPAG